LDGGSNALGEASYMGRKWKFGEESDFVTVRVPKSKRDEYRRAIREFVEKKTSPLFLTRISTIELTTGF